MLLMSTLTPSLQSAVKPQKAPDALTQLQESAAPIGQKLDLPPEATDGRYINAHMKDDTGFFDAMREKFKALKRAPAWIKSFGDAEKELNRTQHKTKTQKTKLNREGIQQIKDEVFHRLKYIGINYGLPLGGAAVGGFFGVLAGTGLALLSPVELSDASFFKVMAASSIVCMCLGGAISSVFEGYVGLLEEMLIYIDDFHEKHSKDVSIPVTIALTAIFSCFLLNAGGEIFSSSFGEAWITGDHHPYVDVEALIGDSLKAMCRSAIFSLGAFGLFSFTNPILKRVFKASSKALKISCNKGAVKEVCQVYENQVVPQGHVWEFFTDTKKGVARQIAYVDGSFKKGIKADLRKLRAKRDEIDDTIAAIKDVRKSEVKSADKSRIDVALDLEIEDLKRLKKELVDTGIEPLNAILKQIPNLVSSLESLQKDHQSVEKMISLGEVRKLSQTLQEETKSLLKEIRAKTIGKTQELAQMVAHAHTTYRVYQEIEDTVDSGS